MLYIQNQINMEGKVVSVVKIMNGSTHSTWSGQNGTFYRHTLTVESKGNMLVGEASTKNSDAAYGPGDEITFEFKTDSHGSKFTGVKKVQTNNSGGGDKTYGANMEHVTRQNAINLSLELMEGFADNVDSTLLTSLITHFHGYINKTTDRAEQYARIASLHFVIKAKKPESHCINTNNWKSTEEIIKAAEKFEAFIISGTALPASFMQFHV